MGQIDVSVNNQKYTLACRDGEEERLSALASYVDEKTKSLVQNLGNVGETRLLLMSALLVADELHEAKEQTEKLASGDSAAVKQAVDERLGALLDEASDKIEGIAEQLESA